MQRTLIGRRSGTILSVGTILGGFVGVWSAWSLWFDGFSIGPPPPPTMEDLYRMIFLNLCLRAVVVFMFCFGGLGATLLLVVATATVTHLACPVNHGRSANRENTASLPD
jgi:uncharacterized protein involved in response to NO